MSGIYFSDVGDAIDEGEREGESVYGDSGYKSISELCSVSSMCGGSGEWAARVVCNMCGQLIFSSKHTLWC